MILQPIMNNKQFIILLLLILIVIIAVGLLEWQVVTILKKPASISQNGESQQSLVSGLSGRVVSLNGSLLTVEVEKSDSGYSLVSYNKANVTITSKTNIVVDDWTTPVTNQQDRGLHPQPLRRTLTLDEFAKEVVNNLRVVIESDENIYTKNDFTAKSIFFVKTAK